MKSHGVAGPAGTPVFCCKDRCWDKVALSLPYAWSITVKHVTHEAQSQNFSCQFLLASKKTCLDTFPLLDPTYRRLKKGWKPVSVSISTMPTTARYLFTLQIIKSIHPRPKPYDLTAPRKADLASPCHRHAAFPPAICNRHRPQVARNV